MRADAQRNRETILRFARELVGQRGANVPMEAIATHAGVGPGTLYRHFPDRQALLDGLVATLVQGVTRACAETLLRFDDDPTTEWSRFVDVLVELGVGSLFPAMGPALAQFNGFEDPASSVNQARVALATAVGGVLEKASKAGLLREDISSVEFVMLVSKAMRPVGVPELVSAPDDRRAIAVLLAGLRPDGTELPGEGPCSFRLPDELAHLVNRPRRT